MEQRGPGDAMVEETSGSVRGPASVASRLPDVRTGSAFEEACAAVLAYLDAEVPLGFWAISRRENDRETYLRLGDNVYGLRQGDSFPWADTYCRLMAEGAAPAVAPDAQSVPAYAAAAVNRVATIGAYAGATIHDRSGEVFGTICGLDPSPQSATLAEAEPLLTLLARLLSLSLAADRESRETRRRESALRAESRTDALTGVLNRRGWDDAIEAVAADVVDFADPTVVVILDLDGLKAINDGPGGHAAGDAHIRAAAAALVDSVRQQDVVARTGGDEFALLLLDCSESLARRVIQRVEGALARAGVRASVGWASARPTEPLSEAVARADTAMYVMKRDRRRSGSAPGR